MLIGIEQYQARELYEHIYHSAWSEMSDRLRGIAESLPFYATPEINELISDQIAVNLLEQVYEAGAFEVDDFTLLPEGLRDFMDLAGIFADTPNGFLTFWAETTRSRIYEGGSSFSTHDWSYWSEREASTLYNIYERDLLNANGFAYAAFVAISHVWVYMKAKNPSWNDVFSENAQKNLCLFDFSREVHEAFESHMNDLAIEVATVTDHPLLNLPSDESEEEQNDKKLTTAEAVMIFNALFKSSDIKNCDLSAKARLISAITGTNYDNIYKKLSRPFEGTEKVVAKRKSNIRPLLRDLNHEGIMLNINEEG